MIKGILKRIKKSQIPSTNIQIMTEISITEIQNLRLTNMCFGY